MQTLSPEILNDKFQIIDCLKKDEHSAVYSAFNEKKKKVIIKVLDTSNLPDISILERFKREAKILSGLEHPNINNVLDYWSDEKKFFISFEFFDSKNLRSYLKSNKPTEEQKRYLVKQLFSGINYAHSKGIIHRDIKPENIIVSSDSLELKIIDFGLAFGMNDSLVTAQYSLVGTPSYMSPEQIQGERPSFKSDLFSAGVVAYEIYTGINPFLGQDINDTLNKILSYDEQSHLDLLNELPDDIKEIITGLLKKEPEKRIDSAASVLGILKESHVKEFRIKKNRIVISLAALFILFLAIIFYITMKSSFEINADKNISNDSLTITFPASTKTFQDASGNKDQDIKKTLTAPEIQEQKNDPVAQSSVIKYKGELAVECIPWAYVYVDSIRTDVTPLKGNLVLDEGNHFIRLIHPNYPVFSKTVNIKGNQETRIKINLDTLFGFLDCKVSPWGEIYINNEYKGETPIQSPIRLVPGSYKIIIKNKSFNNAEYSVRITQNQTFTLKHNFKEMN